MCYCLGFIFVVPAIFSIYYHIVVMKVIAYICEHGKVATTRPNKVGSVIGQTISQVFLEIFQHFEKYAYLLFSLRVDETIDIKLEQG